VASGTAAIALDVGDEPHRFDNPLLPKTRSEMALPLRSRGQVVGAMTVQDSKEAAFQESDIAVMQTMADQVAVAIDNARLFAETEAALEDMAATHQRYLGRAWTEYLTSMSQQGYAQTPAGLVPLGEETSTRAEASDQGHEDGSPLPMLVPIRQQDVPIGVIGIGQPESGRQWTDEEIALVEAIAAQFSLAADNLRLLEETQRRAAQERLVGEVTSHFRETLDVDTMLRTAASEIREALGLSRLTVQLATEPDGPNKD